ncbi:MAG: sulfotransferase domain-containing protein [Anaerolineales bacterium]|jgi:LPS sulfotransferase NodH|nr:sulfotransferase domain-containing protein [Anaerolineales bacterium]
MSIKKYIPQPIKKTLRPLYLRMLPAPRQFVILTRGRSGSNMLVSLLCLHPKIHMQNEIFHEAIVTSQGVQAAINSAGAVSYVKQSFQRMDYEIATGFKLLYPYLEPEYAERIGVRSLPGVVDYLAQEKNIHIIHLKRRNKLKTLASVKLARLSKKYIRFDDQDPMNDEQQILLTAEECESFFLQMEAWETKYDQLFAGDRLLNLYYEELVADIPGKSREIQNFLQIPYYPLAPTTKKQTSKPLPETIANYAELKAHFQASPWGSYFS